MIPGSPPWAVRAACRGYPVDLWNAPDAPNGTGIEGSAQRRRREAAAKEVCATCAVRAECLTWALDTGDRHAVLGGTTPEERRALTRQEATP